jgi:hypothetical protein
MAKEPPVKKPAMTVEMVFSCRCQQDSLTTGFVEEASQLIRLDVTAEGWQTH